MNQPSGRFPTTRWSLVAALNSGSPLAAEEALAQLCQTYWYPIYAFIRRQGHASPDAEDLTQAFFHRLISHESLGKAAREKGRLRSFLLGALKNFMASQYRRDNRLKRGGGQRFLSFAFYGRSIRRGPARSSRTRPGFPFRRKSCEEISIGLFSKPSSGSRIAATPAPARWRSTSSGLARSVLIWKTLCGKATNENHSLQQKLAEAYQAFGVCLRHQGEPKRAEAALRESMAIWETLREASPGDAEVQAGLARTLNNFASLCHAQGEMDQCLALMERAIAIRERLTARDPTNADWLYRSALAHQNLGFVHYSNRNHQQAASSYERALDVWDRLREQSATLHRWRAHWIQGVELAGKVHAALWAEALAAADWEGARAHAGKAWQLSLAFWRELPSAAERRYQSARVALDLAAMHGQMKEPKQAEAYFQIARYLVGSLQATKFSAKPADLGHDRRRLQGMAKVFPESSGSEFRPDPTTLERVAGMPDFLLAEIEAASGRHEQALQWLPPLEHCTPYHLSQRAEISARLGRTEEALDLLRRAIAQSEASQEERQLHYLMRRRYDLLREVAPHSLAVSDYCRGQRVVFPENGHAYQRIDLATSWDDAVAICQAMGGHLVTVTSDAENRFVLEHFASDRLCWLGATAVDGVHWHWITGEPFTFQKFAETSAPTASRHPVMGTTSITHLGNPVYAPGEEWAAEESSGALLFQRVVYPVCEWEPQRSLRDGLP